MFTYITASIHSLLAGSLFPLSNNQPLFAPIRILNYMNKRIGFAWLGKMIIVITIIILDGVERKEENAFLF